MSKKKYCNNCHCLINIIDFSFEGQQSGKEFYFCSTSCMPKFNEMKTNTEPDKPLIQEDPDKLLEACINTPPLRLKDLKERLKKEREEKRNSEKKSEDKKDSK